MIRIFAAIHVPDEIARRLAGLGTGIKGARAVNPENMHITLRFFGNVDEDIAGEIMHRLASITMDGFAIDVRGLGTFGRPAHALWAGVADAPAGTLAALQKKTEIAAVASGLEAETRKFSPHITLARFKRNSRGVESRLAPVFEQAGDSDFGSFTVNGFRIYQSHLSEKGAEYSVLEEFSFSPVGDYR